MNGVATALMKGAGQLGDPAVVRVLIKSLLVTLVVFAGLAWAIWIAGEAALEWAVLPYLPESYAGPAAAVIAVFASAVLFWLSFRIVAVAVLQFFADEIVAAVENRHYPQAARAARKLPLARELTNALGGIGRTLAFNAVALVISLLLIFTAIGPAAVFLLVNGLLLGRELTDMAWFRHCGDPPGPNPVPKVQRLMLGVVIGAIMLVPLANFIGAILGAAAGTHLLHQARELNKGMGA